MRINYIALIFLFCIFLLFSCSKGKEAQKVSPEKKSPYTIELLPEGATKNTPISVKVKGIKPSDLSYQWIVNDVEIEGATENILMYSQLKKHDGVQVKVFIKGQEELISEPLFISNLIPQIQAARFTPQNPRKDDELTVDVRTSDGDDDAVSLLYEWFVNGEASGETSDSIMLNELSVKRGDKISVKITPTDGEDEGAPITIYTYIVNSPPKILPDIKAGFDGSLYTSRVIANDPDEDTLSFALKDAPAGMTINPQTGVITWEVKPEDKGEHNITVSVSDGNGGETIVPFTARIIFAPPPPGK